MYVQKMLYLWYLTNIGHEESGLHASKLHLPLISLLVKNPGPRASGALTFALLALKKQNN